MAEHLPEELIVKILTGLPVKSIIRFSCVSKRWRSIIFDPQFAKSHYKVSSEQQTPNNRRLLISTFTEVESVDLGAPSSASSIRKLAAPFKQSESGIGAVKLLGSCNGLVCVAQYFTRSSYIWNPSTGLLHKLPELGPEICCIEYSGFGYLLATDDYKVVVSTASPDLSEVEIFSLRARVWKRIHDPLLLFVSLSAADSGVVLNEALHWLDDCGRNETGIVTLDLATEEFRTIPLPNVRTDDNAKICMCVSGGCLYVLRCPMVDTNGIWRDGLPWDCIELWVMTEYDVPDSWTKLFNFKVSNRPEFIHHLTPILVTETSTLVAKVTGYSSMYRNRLVRIEHEQNKLAIERDNAPDCCNFMIVYQESLLWIDEYLTAEDKVNTGK